ncbi:MAG: sensor histidine kinase, partial [Microbacterium sp.]
MDLATRVAASVRRHPMIADAALAIAFAIAALISVKAILDESRAFDPSYPQPATAAVVVSMLALTLPLAWRRRFPCSVAGIVVCAFLYCRIVGEIPEASVTLLAGSLALYSVAVHGRPRVRTPVLVLCLGAILAEVVRELYFIPPGSDLQPLSQTFFLAYNVVVLSLPWALGAAIRSWREREQELADRAAELQREREENARQAVFAERVRIARELHDVVAHHVSVMGVQAGAARLVMGREPGKATAALAS